MDNPFVYANTKPLTITTGAQWFAKWKDFKRVTVLLALVTHLNTSYILQVQVLV